MLGGGGVSLLPWETGLIQHSSHGYSLRILLNTVFLEKATSRLKMGCENKGSCHPYCPSCRSVDDPLAPDVEAQGTRHMWASGARIRHHLQQGRITTSGNASQNSFEPKSQKANHPDQEGGEEGRLPHWHHLLTAPRALPWCPGCACLSPGSALCP